MKTRVTPIRSAIAFTLIEVLLAIGIFSMVMAAIYSSWSAILRGSRSGLAAAAEVQRARITIRALEESLGSSLLYADNIKYYAFFVDTSSDLAALSFVARLPQSFPGSGLFPGQDLRRVTFEVDPQGTLLLRQSPLLEATDVIGEPYTIKLAPEVTTFAMEFFDARTAQWAPEWPFTNQLPRLVRVALGFGKSPGGGSQRLTMRTIPLNSIAITRIGAAGAGAGGAPNNALPGAVPGGVQGDMGPGGPGGPGRGRGERGDRAGGENFNPGDGRGRGDGRFSPGGGGRGGGGNRFPDAGTLGGGSFGGDGNQQGWQPFRSPNFNPGAPRAGGSFSGFPQNSSRGPGR